MSDEDKALLRDLRTEWGIDFYQACRLIGVLCDRPNTVDGLVSATGLAHRSVQQLLDRLGSRVVRDGVRCWVMPDAVDGLREAFSVAALPPDPWLLLARQHPSREALVSDLALRPRPDRNLDHVAATVDTALKRALYLSNRFDLRSGPILMLGDHDMTALALAHVQPGLELFVSDIDERLLSFVSERSQAYGWGIQTRFADFRVGLPVDLRGRCDLVFTDPPYSVSGVGLFLRRAVAALRDHEFARIVLSYGYGERQRTLGYQVQGALRELRLLSEAVLPSFNVYDGAPSLGGRSDLYLLRPTKKSAAAVAREDERAQIYTQGRRSRESQKSTLPVPIQQEIVSVVGDQGALWVGDGPDLPQLSSLHRVGLRAYHHGLRRGVRVVSGAQRVVLNLYPHFASQILRQILTARADVLLVCAPQRPLADLFAHPSPVRALVEARYQVVSRRQDGNAAVIHLLRRTDAPVSAAAAALRALCGRSRARLSNAWRDALLAAAAHAGAPLQKNQARQVVAESVLGDTFGAASVDALPLWVLERLGAAVSESVASVLPAEG